MKIYSMTATFGKLNHQTLDLTAGLNIIEAPNEWGKSTWCAFMIAMLYGIDTRQQTTKAALADKERFAPWHGEPMSGRMELCWNGRDITIERSTKGRIPFGSFRAYETATGLDVTELTAANCGQVLLGVERNVFTRSGFIRLQDMPVTQDDALRRRLNNLVTTGDESGAGDRLGQQLKDLKNKCRYNRSGLLPQAEYEREQLRSQLQQQQELQLQIGQIKVRRTELEQHLKLLDNHADALRYEAAQQGIEKLKEAEKLCSQLQIEADEAAQNCKKLPGLDAVETALQEGGNLQKQQILLSYTSLPEKPEKPEIAGRYQGISPEAAIANAAADYTQFQALQSNRQKQANGARICGISAGILLAVLAVCHFAASFLTPLIYYIASALILLAGFSMAAYCAVKAKKSSQCLENLRQKHLDILPENWMADAQNYANTQSGYLHMLESYNAQYQQLAAEQAALQQRITQYAGSDTLETVIARWEESLQQYRSLDEKQKRLTNAREHLAALQAVAITAPEPAFEDNMTLTAEQTEAELDNIHFELRQLELRLGQCIGQAETLGEETTLKARLDSVNRRIHRLEDHYKALELAQDALHQASTALQRRFAPRISKKAQEYFCRLTGGRYQRIALSDDLSVSASAENEDTLRGAQWRSDGTVDQLYLALRLAVAGELTPDAPLVLDDALIRFDDKRLKEALSLLKEEAKNKQVILFTCQSREKALLN